MPVQSGQADGPGEVPSGAGGTPGAPRPSGRGWSPGRVVALVSAAIAGIVGVLLSEGWIVGSVALLGPVWAFLLVSTVCSAISVVIAYAYDAQEGRHGPGVTIARLRAWIASKEEYVNRRVAALARFSEWVAFVIMSVTIGPFLTAVAVKVRGGGRGFAYALCVASSVLFSAVWVAVYSGGIAVVRKVFFG